MVAIDEKHIPRKADLATYCRDSWYDPGRYAAQAALAYHSALAIAAHKFAVMADKLTVGRIRMNWGDI